MSAAARPRASDEFFRPTVQPPTAPASGRRRHDAKITVYLSNEELLDLERARLQLRADHGLVADRGRLVREATNLVLADLAARGADSDLVRRLQER